MSRSGDGAAWQRLTCLVAATYVLTGGAFAQTPRDCPPGVAGCAAVSIKPADVVPKLQPHLQIELDVKNPALQTPAPRVEINPRKLPDGIKIEVLTLPKGTEDNSPKTTDDKPEAAPKHDQNKPRARPAARHSWDGLPQIAAKRLTRDDLLDIPGQYIIDFNPAAFAAAGLNLQTITLADLAARLAIEPTQIRSIQRRFMRSAVVRASAQQAAALAANPLVSAVHADTKIKASGGAPPLSWGLDRLDSPQRPLDGKFDRESGAYAARVYLFDSEAANVSTELEDRLVVGARFLPTPDAQEACDGHGSQMASLIGGRTTGSAPRAQIVSLVVLPCDSEKTGDGASLVEAAEWLLMREAELKAATPAIANMSLASKWSRKINSVVEILTENGVAVVAAAGNNSDDACRYSPASAKDAITVGATGPNDETADSSNFGDCVKIHAPGELVTALKGDAGNTYVAANGTSGAAALVSGVLARALERRGAAEARNHLLNAALPGRFWTRKDGSAPLAQLSPAWRSYCRIARRGHAQSLSLHKSPGGKAIGSLAPDTLVVAERKSDAWILVRLARGGDGWIAGGKKDPWPLLRSDSEEPCPQPP